MRPGARYGMRSAGAAVALLLATATPTLGCYIQGQDSGVCQAVEERVDQLPFCRSAVQYPTACFPKEYGYFSNHTLRQKDLWLQRYYEATVARRVAVEDANGRGMSLLPWEGEPGHVTVRFYKEPDCQDAFKNLLCYMNFPRCDEARNSLLVCKSACENFFKACNYPREMWRCGPIEYYGGDGPEDASNLDQDGVPVFARSMFPGLPFVDNAGYGSGKDRVEFPICTPALPGAALSAKVSGAAIAAAVGAGVALLCMPGVWGVAADVRRDRRRKQHGGG